MVPYVHFLGAELGRRGLGPVVNPGTGLALLLHQIGSRGGRSMARFIVRLVVVGLMAASWSVAADPEGGEKRI